MDVPRSGSRTLQILVKMNDLKTMADVAPIDLIQDSELRGVQQTRRLRDF